MTAGPPGGQRGRRPTLRSLASLLAGRTAFRLALLGANAALLASWGQAGYEPYAAAMGTAQVLTTLTALGIEKSALKLVPRATRTGPQLITVLLLSALLLTGAAVVWLACAALFVRSGDAVALGLLAGLYAALLGLNTVLVGLCRALDRNRADVLNFAALSLVIVAGAGGVALLGWGPVAFTGWILGGTALLNLAHLPALYRATGRPVRGGVVRPVVTTSALMACGDIAAAGTVSLLFMVLGASRHHEQTGHLYLMILASSVLLNGFGYLLRLFQPHVSLTLRSVDPASLDRRVVRRLLPVAAAGAVWSAGSLGLAWWAERTALAPPPVVVLLLYVLCVPLFFTVGSLNYLLENATPHTLRATALSALGGLLCAVLLGLVLVPALGALGAVTALASGEVTHAVLARLLLRSPLSARPPRGSRPAHRRQEPPPRVPRTPAAAPAAPAAPVPTANPAVPTDLGAPR
ncbi:hypothetical protein GTY66_01390 [Streptomyces sp. SID8356]|uniref:oligosaccharide flippase family protein n=1 Tax=unclassified Streptomyces TaxID=2593676 RepID=UPI0003634172|nr:MULTISPECIES: oligosaccharide flippase family protein [unclassified Streptomyces]MYT34730.1 hypothetical protein [Streptomyces sp. SID8356]